MTDQIVENERIRFVAPTEERKIPWLARGWHVQAMRVVFRVLCAFAPAIAARLVDRLWFTPPKGTVRPDDQEFLRNADEALSFKVNGRALSAWSWGQGPVVILMHGWGGSAGQFRSFVEPLVRAGFRAVAFDAPAHGASDAARSGDSRATFFEFSHALQEVDRALGPSVGLIAHSGGCTAASLAVRDGWCAPQRMVFIAPFVLPNAYMAPFGRALAISPAVMAEFRERAQNRLGRPLSDFDMHGVAPIACKSPLLLVHDRGDYEVPISDSFDLSAAWRRSILMETTGLGHRRILHDGAVVDRTVAFFTDPLPVEVPL
jgi:pimeloyl-ACP methyl ester carboxylesterase